MSEVRTRDRLLDPRLSRVFGWALDRLPGRARAVRALGRARGRDAAAKRSGSCTCTSRPPGSPTSRSSSPRSRRRCSSGRAPARWSGTASPARRPSSACCSPRSRSCWARSGASRSGASGGRGTPALVTTAVLFFLYLGYLALRRIPAATRSAARKRNAIAALIAFVDVPIVHFSVEWWRTLHQEATVFNPELSAKIDGRDGVHALDRRHRVHDRSTCTCSTAATGSPRSRTSWRSARSTPRSPSGSRAAMRSDATGRGRPMRLAAQLADADYGWAYVIVGWTLTGAVLAAYFGGWWCASGARSGRSRRRPNGDHDRPARDRSRSGRGTSSPPVGACSRSSPSIVLTIVLVRERRLLPHRLRGGQGPEEPGTDRFRLAGAVVPGSIDETPRGVQFELTDGKKTVAVVHRGDPPELFKNERAGGRARAAGPRCDAGAPFDSDRIMIKHGNEYEPPKVDTKKRRPDERPTSVRESRARDPAASRWVSARRRSASFLLAAGPRPQRPGDAAQRSALRRSSCSRAAILAVAAMEWALITHDFSIRYVAENNARSTPAAVHDHRRCGPRSRARSCCGS